MKVHELIEILSTLNQNNEVVIKDPNPKQLKEGELRMTEPLLNLEHVFQGFDWDTGKTFLYFEDKGDESVSA